ncbi:TIGR04255 family protein [Mycobacterium haemophilum]|nr:TIGR04255 family protein [Mycobacterium haemophilum]
MPDVTGVAPRQEYPSPPVHEVICQVTFADPVPWSAATPGLLYRAVQDEYPAEPKSQTAVEASFDPSDGEVQVSRGAQRFVYSNEEQNRRFVVNERCLSVNALKPYENWPSLAQRFRRALDIFEKEVAEFKSASVSLRYINRIVIQGTAIDTSEYFTVPLVTTHQPNARIVGFFGRSQSISPETSINTTVTFASVEHSVDGESAFILDIDLAMPTPSDAGHDKLAELVNELHHWENHEFESSITDKCRKLFK